MPHLSDLGLVHERNHRPGRRRAGSGEPPEGRGVGEDGARPDPLLGVRLGEHGGPGLERFIKNKTKLRKGKESRGYSPPKMIKTQQRRHWRREQTDGVRRDGLLILRCGEEEGALEGADGGDDGAAEGEVAGAKGS